MTVVDSTAACACGWTAGPLRASRRTGELLTAERRATESGAAHLRRVGLRRQ